MPYDPRTLSYHVEIIHPPIQHDAAKLQALHTDLFQDTRLGYRNFALVQGGATLSNPTQQPQIVSAASFLADRLQVREAMTAITLEDFRSKARRLLELAIEKVGIQSVALQQVVIHSLIQPRHFQDSRQFMGSSVFSIPEERYAAIGRPAQLLGFRAVYPQTSDSQNAFAVRIESFDQDPRSVFIEIGGTFPRTPGTQADHLQFLEEGIDATYRFLNEHVLVFLEQFDQPRM